MGPSRTGFRGCQRVSSVSDRSVDIKRVPNRIQVQSLPFQTALEGTVATSRTAIKKLSRIGRACPPFTAHGGTSLNTMQVEEQGATTYSLSAIRPGLGGREVGVIGKPRNHQSKFNWTGRTVVHRFLPIQKEQVPALCFASLNIA
jgi:hypothetical protein